jgi:hypothetical protein
MRQRSSGQQRLRAFLRRRPLALQTLTLRAIGREVGLSGERVRQLLPRIMPIETGHLPRERRQHERHKLEQRLRRFVTKRPRVIETPARGGMTYVALATRLNVSPTAISRAWRALGLPDRSGPQLTRREKSLRYYWRNPEKKIADTLHWRLQHPERWREISRQANRKYAAKVLRQETCITCGKRFAWTQGQENRHRQRNTRIFCSSRCRAAPRPYGRSRGRQPR